MVKDKLVITAIYWLHDLEQKFPIFSESQFIYKIGMTVPVSKGHGEDQVR